MTKVQISITRELVDDPEDDETIGVCAKAHIKIPYEHDWITTTLSSPGLWRIERDADNAYLDATFSEEREILIDMLTSLRNWELVT